ncbi:MAG: M48 family metalloprotease [Verrucomicrobiae bacterium]|nr:M48 family metalloprotease [Verrucomicrobiae bacterium]
MKTWIEFLNRAGETAMPVALAAFVQVSGVVLVLLVLDRLLARRVRAVFRHALWLLVPLKLLLPPGVALPTSAAYWLRMEAPVAEQMRGEVFNGDVRVGYADGIAGIHDAADRAPGEGQDTVGQPGLTLRGGGVLGWFVGFAGLAGWMAWGAVRVRRTVREGRRGTATLEAMAVGAAAELGLGRTPRVVVCERAGTPAVCGLWRPVVVMPPSLVDGLDAEPMRAVLLHEMAHVKRGDLGWNLLQSALLAVYWWHPLVWVAQARMRRVREEAVDETVAVVLRGETEGYARALVRVARHAVRRRAPGLGWVGILESRSALHERVRRLISLPTPGSARLGMVQRLSVGLLAVGLLPMAPRSSDQEAATGAVGASVPREVAAATERGGTTVVAGGDALPEDSESIAALVQAIKEGNEELAAMLLRYRSGWPPVIQQRMRIAELEARLAERRLRDGGRSSLEPLWTDQGASAGEALTGPAITGASMKLLTVLVADASPPYYVGGDLPTMLSELAPRLRALGTDPETVLMVRAEQRASWDSVAALIEAARASGIRRVSLSRAEGAGPVGIPAGTSPVLRASPARMIQLEAVVYQWSAATRQAVGLGGDAEGSMVPMTRARMQGVRRTAEASEDAVIMNLHRVTTLEGRAATFEVEEPAASLRRLGLSRLRMEVLPRPSGDGYTFELELGTQWTDVIPVVKDGTAAADARVEPRQEGGVYSVNAVGYINSRRNGRVRLYDGQSVWIPLPRSSVFPAEDASTRDRWLQVTAQTIDPAGNPIHTREAETVPTQE